MTRMCKIAWGFAHSALLIYGQFSGGTGCCVFDTARHQRALNLLLYKLGRYSWMVPVHTGHCTMR